MAKYEFKCKECGKLLYETDNPNAAEYFAKFFKESIGKSVGIPDYASQDVSIVRVYIVDDKDTMLCKDCFEKDGRYAVCVDCNTIINVDEDEGYEVFGKGYHCGDCVDEKYFYCECCEAYHNRYISDLREVNVGYEVQTWCSDCAYDNAWQCEDCGEWFSEHEDYYIIQRPHRQICENCYDSGDYHMCEDCEDYYHADYGRYIGDSFYCRDCASDHNEIIYGYHDYPDDWEFRNTLKDRKDDDRLVSTREIRNRVLHIGWELEIDGAGEDDDNAVAITTALGHPADESLEFKCSHDSSLNDGFEIISMPATLDFHLTKYKIKDGLDKASRLGYKSHDVDTCGLHFHIDREYFSGSMENPEDGFVILLSNNRHWFEVFSRRTRWGYCQFINENRGFTPDDFKNGKETSTEQRLETLRRGYRGHGSAVNFCGHSTIEVRFIRGTLKYSTFVASLQFVEMLAYAVKHLRKTQLSTVDVRWFKRFATRKGYTEFLDYLEARGIMS